MRGSHLIKHWSRTQKTVTLSSGEAELGGVVTATAEGLGAQSVARDLGLELDVKVFADSSAAIGICSRSGLGRVRHLAVGQLWVQERVRLGEIKLGKVLGTDNPADLLTKFLSRPQIQQHVATMGGKFIDGRAASAPALAADVLPWLSS